MITTKHVFVDDVPLSIGIPRHSLMVFLIEMTYFASDLDFIKILHFSFWRLEFILGSGAPALICSLFCALNTLMIW